jgi:hypothetical protein
MSIKVRGDNLVLKVDEVVFRGAAKVLRSAGKRVAGMATWCEEYSARMERAIRLNKQLDLAESIIRRWPDE